MPAAIPVALAAVSVAVGTAGAVVSYEGQQREAKSRQAMADMQAQQERLDQVRQSRIRMAQIQQAGVNQGVGESSSVTTGASGVQGQAESNIGYIGRQQGLIDNIFSAQQVVSAGQGIGEIGQAIGKVGGVVTENQPYLQKHFPNIFGTPGT